MLLSSFHRSLTDLPWRRDHAELLQHAQRVEVEPAFHELAVHDAVNSNSRDRHRLACRWNAHELALMRATKRRATGDKVPFGKFAFHGETRIGEGRQVE